MKHADMIEVEDIISQLTRLIFNELSFDGVTSKNTTDLLGLSCDTLKITVESMSRDLENKESN